MNVAEFTEWIIAKEIVNANKTADLFLKFLRMKVYSHKNSNIPNMCPICIKIRHLSLPTHIQIHASNIAKS
jgi:hypothetical protein